MASYSRLAPETTPSARYDPPLLYDSAGKQLLLFGGAGNANLNDLWRYSLEDRQWVELHPAGTIPAARFGHTTIYDPVRRRLVLFGGQARGFFNDVWAYDIAANKWTELSPGGSSPSTRYGHSAVFDSKRDRMVISHGFTDSGRFDDTWSFSFATGRWTNLTPSGTKPLKRCLHHAAFDAANDRFLLFGGCSSGFGKCPQDDLWSFDLNANNWKLLPSGPPARERYAMAFDSQRGQLLIFGGSGFPLLNDTWAYDTRKDTWSELTASGDVPAPRSRVEGVYAEDIDAAFWFGGSADNGLSNELYRLTLASGPRIDRVVNSFSGQAGEPAAGELISIFGSNFAQPARFNGEAATTSFASAAQINTRVPSSLEPGKTVELTVGAASETFKVAESHPGLFPTVFHGDGSANGQANPVAAGTPVVIYATGVGPKPVAISIANSPVQVLYAGALAGADGVTQINVLVPANLSPGEAKLTIEGGNTIALFTAPR